jgi:hypothetical protein
VHAAAADLVGFIGVRNRIAGGGGVPSSWGNIFSVGIDGSDYVDLHNFTGGTSGCWPDGDLTLSGGTLFGMTSGYNTQYGAINDGTIFALTLPAPVPEPGTLALVGAVAVAVVSYRWRRTRRTLARRF